MNHLFLQLTQLFQPDRARICRRAFLKASAATGAALLLSRRRVQARGRTPRIVIVGAGFAGLSCAYELVAAGVVPVVLEARGRVGGRVLTLPHPGRGAAAEAGGEFIGAQHHLWGAYAEHFGLPLVSNFESDATLSIAIHGKKLDLDALRALYHEMHDAFGHICRDAQAVDPVQPWRSPAAAALDGTSVAAVLDALPLTALARKVLHAQISGDNAAPTAEMSYLGLLAAVQGGGNATYWTQTEALRCASGNQRLADALAGALPEGSLKLKHAVHSIDMPAGAEAAGAVRVTDADGRHYLCDVCVLAVPPSAWGGIRFAPGLPAALSPRMGSAVKHLAWFDRTRTPGGPTLVLSDADDSNLHGTLWPMLHTNPGSAGDVFFTSGDGADAYRAMDPALREGRRAELGKLGEGPAAVSMSFVDWVAQPYTGSGYSFPAPGEVMRCGPLWDAGLGPLQFIGEHTVPAFVGYMEGALRSGAAMAARIARPTAGGTVVMWRGSGHTP